MSTILAPHPVYGSHPTNSQFSVSTFDDSAKPRQSGDYGRSMSRTPSPTPEEYNLLHGIKPPKTTQQKIKMYAILAVIIGLSILFSIETKNILLGQELVATFVGVTWDLPEAFAIVAVGIILGEIANYLTFKYACSARGAKLEAKSLDYGLLAYVVRNGSFWVILGIRYSAIPSHFATAVFASVGISFWIFLAAAILSLPSQLVPVYVGYVMQPSVEDNGTSKIVENVVLVLGFVVTTVAYKLIKKKMQEATPAFIYARRKSRQVDGGAPSAYDIRLPDIV
ncbi:hypothetical protein K438DRAFT_2172209 [Mycena galopus ATCC 62051]|nr:hypothetical protein K438DRAFT_2172209 [Mycena galopus ATCC 62051]